MSHREFMEWLEYFTRVGRFTPIRMFDGPAALIASRIDRLAGEASNPTKYLPYKDEPAAAQTTTQPATEITMDQVARAFGGLRARR